MGKKPENILQKLTGVIQLLTGDTIEEMANRIDYSRPHLTVLINKGDSEDVVAKLEKEYPGMKEKMEMLFSSDLKRKPKVFIESSANDAEDLKANLSSIHLHLSEIARAQILDTAERSVILEALAVLSGKKPNHLTVQARKKFSEIQAKQKLLGKTSR